MEYRYGAAAAADPRSAWPNIAGGQGFYTVESLAGNPSAASLPLPYSQPPPKSILEPSYEHSRAAAGAQISQHSSQGALGSAFPRPAPADPRLHDISLYSSQGVAGSTLSLPNPYDISLNAPQQGVVSGSTVPRSNPPDARLNDASLYASQGIPRPNPADARLHDASLYSAAAPQGIPGSTLSRSSPAVGGQVPLYSAQGGVPGAALPRPNPSDVSVHSVHGASGSILPQQNPADPRLREIALLSAVHGASGSTLPQQNPPDPRLREIALHSAVHGGSGSILPQQSPADPRLREIALHSASQGVIPGSNLPVANGPDPRRLNLHAEPGYASGALRDPLRDPLRDSLRLQSTLSQDLSRELELRELELRRRQVDRELLLERERAREYREGMIQRELARERQLLARPLPQEILQPRYNDTRKALLNQVPLLPASANKNVLVKKNPLPKASVKRGRTGRPGWCSICKIDCQTKYVLENHHLVGKKHKLKVQELAGRSGNAKKGEANQKQSQEVEKKAQTEQQKQSEGKEGNELSNLGKRKQKGKGEGAASSKKRQRVSDAIVVSTQSCNICNVVCSSQVVLESHLAGKKHAARLAKLQEGSKAESEAKGDSKKNAKDDGTDTKNSEAVAVSENERAKPDENETAMEVKDGKELTDTQEDDAKVDVSLEEDVKDANEEEEEDEEEEEEEEEEEADAKDGSENEEEA